MSAALPQFVPPDDDGDAAARQWLERVVMRLGAEAGGLLILKPDGRRILHSIGHAEASSIAYRDYYSRLDPLGRLLDRRPNGRPLVIDTTRHPDYLAQYELSADYLRPHGIDHLACAQWLSADGTRTLIGVQRFAGMAPFTVADGKQLGLLIGQWRSGLALAATAPDSPAGPECVLQLCIEIAAHLPNPVIVLDTRLTVVWSNRAARDGQGAIHDALFARTTARNAHKLRSQLQHLVLKCVLQRSETLAMLGEEQARVPVALSPLSGSPDLVMLRLTAPEPTHSSLQGRLQALFRLTPAEAELAVQLANGHSPEAIAEMRQVKRETVRNQLKAIYRKTGYNRQNSLVSAILGVRAL